MFTLTVRESTLDTCDLTFRLCCLAAPPLILDVLSACIRHVHILKLPGGQGMK